MEITVPPTWHGNVYGTQVLSEIVYESSGTIPDITKIQVLSEIVYESGGTVRPDVTKIPELVLQVTLHHQPRNNAMKNKR